MIYSPGRRFLFIHIPKTGGTSFARAYEARARADDILVGDTPKAQQRQRRQRDLSVAGRLWKHSTLADLHGLVPADDLCRMVLVRNPWDRMVSYYHWLGVQRFDHPAVRLAQRLEFTDFLNHPQTVAGLRRQPYAAYVRDRLGEVAPTHFVRIEAFEEDFAPVARHLDFSLELPRENTSKRARDWRGYYSDTDAALVGELCAADIARSGYSFAPSFPVSET
ncbi:Type II secretory pathway, pullulanase PulA [Salipiger sp. IMCC34102]|uniref:sulfotransferase family 2 domain-containing protein n=1 Tax=Salipiger sp. IMCC34102 TaxID=2510647 RepID=UPI00101DB781|nr:sulfotransferase family 2 domain-containing protein [Salipiger sp. IMCC34102]RYH02286.1 Type II secretory pathway, pullulanase PulA [Salipiger sp. IMCC34102]